MNTSKNIRLGLVGLDTSHVVAFTQNLNDPSQEFHVPGCRVVAAYPGGSPDFELSHSRVEGFTRQLRDDYSVRIVDSPAQVAELCDAVMLTAVDGRAHWPLLQEIAPVGKPVFIDKPFATSSADARAMVELAQRHHLPLFSSSSLRYAQPLVEAIEADQPIIGADCSGPMALEPTQPGLFWYGIHSVEMLYAILGTGCSSVAATSTTDHEVVIGVWADGRMGTVRGNRLGNGQFGALLHSTASSRYVNATKHPKPYYAALLEEAVRFFQSGKAPVPLDETVEIIRFIEAANESRATGATVNL